MEPITSIADAVYRIGFPAAVAIALLWFLFQVLSSRIDRIDNKIDKQIDALGQRIEENTRAVTYLAVVLARAHGIDPDEMRSFVPGQQR